MQRFLEEKLIIEIRTLNHLAIERNHPIAIKSIAEL
jgi:hypothetical protein